MLEIASVLLGVALSLRFKVVVLAPAMMGGIALSAGLGLTFGYGWTSILATAVLVVVGLQLGYVAGVIIQSVAAAPVRPALSHPPARLVTNPERLAWAASADRKTTTPRRFAVIDGGLRCDHSRADVLLPDPGKLQPPEARKPQTNTARGGLPARISVELAEALRNDWLELWYEPKADPKSLALRGAEASIRIRHPSWGAALPLRSLRIGTAPPTRAACEFAVAHALADWAAFAEARMPIEITVNVPLSVLKDLDFIRFARNHLPIDPRFPGLVIAIDDVLDDSGLVDAVAAELARHNIRLSIDGLTSGCPFWPDKRDVSFAELRVGTRVVAGCAADGVKRELCRAAVATARRFNARSTAAGVETKEDLLAVRDLGFDAAQGSLLGRPLPQQRFVQAARLRLLAANEARGSA